jgi:small subunit ribosomal protein S6
MIGRPIVQREVTNHMKKSHYENVVIVNATLEDEQVESIINHIQETIRINGGEITDVEKLGRKRLAYPIQKSKSGFYIIFRFIAPSNLIVKLERMYRLDESIVRYLTVTLDKRALEHLAKVKAKKEENAEQKTSTEEKTEVNDNFKK